MKNLIIRSVLVVTILLATGQTASTNCDPGEETEWDRLYSLSSNIYIDNGAAVKHTTDGGYIVAGTHPTPGITKLNECGDVMWYQPLPVGDAVIQTTDGGFAVTGSSGTIVRTDSIGNTLWSRSYPNGWDALCQTTDGGYVLMNSYPGVVIKITTAGDSLWSALSDPDCQFNSVAAANDGSVILVGDYDSENISKAYLTKLNSSGIIEWSEVLDTLFTSRGLSVHQTPDGGYVLAGTAIDAETSWNDEPLVVKTDATGQRSWARTYETVPATCCIYYFAINLTSDGGYIAVSEENNNLSRVLRLDASGDTLWTKLYDAEGIYPRCVPFFTSVCQTQDGGYMTGGYRLCTGGDVWTRIVKIASDAPAPCCENRGNVDHVIGGAGPVDVADLTFLIAYLFTGGPPPPCEEEGNVDGITGEGGMIDVGDLSYLVAFLFTGGPPSPAC